MRTKIALFLLVLIAVVTTPKTDLEAGWGKTSETFLFEKTFWQGVQYDMNDLAFTAFIPNYKNTLMNNGFVALSGQIGKNIAYAISTSVDANFIPPSSYAEFLSATQAEFPEYVVDVKEHSLENALYVLDMVPLNTDENYFVRIISTANRLIFMVTNDLNEARRHKFYESISIK